MDHLCELTNDNARREVLNDLPPDLQSTYVRILKRIDRKSRDIRKLVQRTLRWLAYASAELSTTALCEAVSIKDDTVTLDRNAVPDEKEILRYRSSLVGNLFPLQLWS